MSLLLEALKKAEQAKRGSHAAIPQPTPADKPDPHATPAALPEPGFPEISLAEVALPEPPPVPPPTTPRRPEAKAEPVLSLGLPEPPPAPASASLPPPATKPASGAPAFAEAAGGASKNQETAKKILAAKQGCPKRNFQLLGGILAVAMVFGAAAAYYFRQAAAPAPPALAPAGASHPAAMPSPSPPVALPIASPTVTPPQPPAENPTTATKPDERLPADTLANIARVAGVTGVAGVARMEPPSLQLSPGGGEGDRPLSRLRERVRERDGGPPGRQEPPPPATPSNARDSAHSIQPPAGDSAIKIRRSAGEPRLDPLLDSAYQAFMAGDAGKAEADYRKALQQTPNSRDALLGLAAIAANRNQAQEAASHYLRVLQLDPRDAAAQAGLIGLRGGSDPALSESRLKTLLAQHPDAGYLHFALGNLYAAQSRWPEAQEAYFNALHSDPGNADYGFNLAVSLDHLDQRKPALAYYQRALILAKDRPAGFDNELLKKRIHELQAPD